MNDMETVTSDAEGNPVLRVDGSQPLSARTVAALDDFCGRAEDRAPGGAVIVEVAGVPTEGWTTGIDVRLVNKWERSLRRLERLESPVVAVAHGDCGGVAAEVLLASDYRLVTGTACLVMPADRDGLWPGMGLYRLVKQAGVGRTRRAMLLRAPISLDEALELHLFDEVVDSVADGYKVAADLGGFGVEIAVRRGLMLAADTTPYEEALGRHLAACDRVLRPSSSTGVR